MATQEASALPASDGRVSAKGVATLVMASAVLMVGGRAQLARLRARHVDVEVIPELHPDVRNAILPAQARPVMLNPSAATSHGAGGNRELVQAGRVSNKPV